MSQEREDLQDAATFPDEREELIDRLVKNLTDEQIRSEFDLFRAQNPDVAARWTAYIRREVSSWLE